MDATRLADLEHANMIEAPGLLGGYVDGAAAGCDIATLQASEMGRPIYEQLGYRTVVEYMAYIEPPTAE